MTVKKNGMSKAVKRMIKVASFSDLVKMQKEIIEENGMCHKNETRKYGSKYVRFDTSKHA
jgi:hypothetical protein